MALEVPMCSEVLLQTGAIWHLRMMNFWFNKVRAELHFGFDGLLFTVSKNTGDFGQEELWQ